MVTATAISAVDGARRTTANLQVGEVARCSTNLGPVSLACLVSAAVLAVAVSAVALVAIRFGLLGVELAERLELVATGTLLLVHAGENISSIVVLARIEKGCQPVLRRD
jgi:hypothetical protein